MSRILIITTSLRAKSNSDILAEQMAAGAKAAGHQVECISLKGKTIGFCRGCLACQKTQKCVLNDDAVAIAEKVIDADTLVFVTPIYYYEMSGQIVATVAHQISNARVEATNNKIKLTIRMAYGFRNIDNLIAMIYLRCGGRVIYLPGRATGKVV